VSPTSLGPDSDDADLARRFGGLERLYGPEAYARLRAARFTVVGVGGVGSWAAEALARSGVSRLTLIDLDHVGESNINRQVHALTPTLGQAKVLALKERIALIHPGCQVDAVEEFVDEANVGQLLSAADTDVVIDCCDQVRAKAAVAAWGCLRQRHEGPRKGPMKVACVFSREAVRGSQAASCEQPQRSGSLNCAGYGSSVMVTATFGMVAAAHALKLVL
jgi:tRNA A37 threonylcarbamoyladenosine dehydratase